jgi:hypothetical protein
MVSENAVPAGVPERSEREGVRLPWEAGSRVGLCWVAG